MHEIWCLYLAVIDKLSDGNLRTMYLMIVVDVFPTLFQVGTLRYEKVDSNRACFIKKICPEGDKLTFFGKNGIDLRKEFLADYKNFCIVVGFQV